MAEIWLQSGLPEDLCQKYPELNQYGLYRELNSGKYELISYCSVIPDSNGGRFPASQNYVSMQKDKFNQLIDKLLPAK